MSRTKTDDVAIATGVKHAVRVISSTDPIINLEDLSLDDIMKMNVVETRLSRLQVLQMRHDAGNTPVEILDEMVALAHPDALMAVYDDMRRLMALVVRYVPRDWMTNSAPESPDWSDPETYRHLRADKSHKLRRMIRMAQQADEAAKN